MSPKPGFRIYEIRAWTAIGDDDEEGICAFQAPDGTWMPMIAADIQRLTDLRPFAAMIAQSSGKQVRLRCFVPAPFDEVLEVIDP